MIMTKQKSNGKGQVASRLSDTSLLTDSGHQFLSLEFINAYIDSMIAKEAY